MARKWNIPLTYKPKIEAVFSGECHQTIRKGLKFSVGDLISFHTWEGRPYRSKWDKRTPYFEIHKILRISVYPNGFKLHHAWVTDIIPWTDKTADYFAYEDGIDPPFGLELKKVLFGLNGKIELGETFQIIRWRLIKE